MFSAMKDRKKTEGELDDHQISFRIRKIRILPTLFKLKCQEQEVAGSSVTDVASTVLLMRVIKIKIRC